ncbi:MAG TPA: cytochrome c-type biogenesis protein CcmH [Solirubrobacteraceae bacterium]|jgi:cytochrome c-type biogenesis protein CcmH|nr:cytochrome c-type biogenesis protein CcmH [Solirubrobacteraceae bacterium]
MHVATAERSHGRRRAAALLFLLIGLAGCQLAGAGAVDAASRPTLPAIERQVMCVSCKIPLNVAQSQQADRERAFIQGLIDEGRSESQIKRALVGQYGPAVLGLPATHGFDLAAYLVPLAVVLALLAMLAMLLPRWRRHSPPDGGRSDASPALDPSDAARLDADLARFK